MAPGPAAVIADIQIPADPRAPVLVDLEVHALKVALVERTAVKQLDIANWNKPGVYILIGPLGGSQTTLYVGKSGLGKDGVRARVMRHANKGSKDSKKKKAKEENANFPWWRALLVTRDTTDGFNAAQIGYLEGRLASELKQLPLVTVRGSRDDMDTSLGEAKRAALDEFVPSILAALKLAGIPLREQEEEKPPTGAGKASYSVKISDLISKGLLEVGATLTYTNKGKAAEATVTQNGSLVVDGVAYTNPSAAGRDAHNLKNRPNGWDVWRLDGGEGKSLSDLRQELLDS